MADQVEEVKQKVDIVSIIGERIELKKAGRNYKALCPFHSEKTPSFMVSPELQIFKCFGCGLGGDVFAFLREYEGMEFREALKYLADRVGVKLQPFRGEVASEKERLIEINTHALRFYNYLLLNHEIGKKALHYLLKERGLKRQTIEEFRLGYSPESPSALKKFLIDKKKFGASEVERAGIAVVRNGNIFDRFSGRVIFPLFDHRGNVIGFAGRVLPGAREDLAKYINSPETPVYHKSNVLYGLNLSRQMIKKKGVAIVVEGELDAISSYQIGIKNIVAIKGSALTEEQVRLLSRFAPKAILALDTDFAGDAAARRGITVASNFGLEVKIARLAGFKDPDEAARGDPEFYKKALISAVGVWDFLVDLIFEKFGTKGGEAKARISKELTPILASIEDKIVQAHYLNLVAQRLGVSLEAVSEQVEKSLQSQEAPEIALPQKPKEKDRRTLLEERLLSLAFRSDPTILEASEVSSLIQTPLCQRILEEYFAYAKRSQIFNTSEFSSTLPKELFEGFAEMILKESQDEDENPEVFKKELDLVKKELKILGIRQELSALTQKIKELEEKGEKDKLLKVQEKFQKLAATLSRLETQDLSGVIIQEPQT